MRYPKLFAAILIAALTALPAATMAAEGEDPVVATVGDVEVYASELQLAESELDPQFADMPEEQRRTAALAAVIDIKTLARKAESTNLEASDSFKKQMSFLRDRTLHNEMFRKEVVEPITEEEVKARYEKEVAATAAQEEVHARHILLKTEEEAKAVIADLENGKDFVELAKEKSSGPSASQGGDLGYFTKGRMVPEFEEAAFALQPGEFSKEPVKSEFGWHVLKVEDRRDAAPPAFEQVADQVRQVLLRERYAEVMNEAREEVKIEVIDPALKEGYNKITAQRQ